MVSSTDDLRGLSIKELRSLITSNGLTTTGCVDKSDLIERAAEALAGSSGGRGGGDAEAVESAVAALKMADVLPSLEATLKQPPSQATALHANACLERLTTSLMEDDLGAALPRDRLMTAILGGMKLGLGGQGGLFTMACLPLPYALHLPDELANDGSTPDLQSVIDEAEDANGTTFFETLLAGLAKFDKGAEMQGSILMTLRVWLAAQIHNDGEDDMVALCDGEDGPQRVLEMLHAGLLPAVVRPMLKYAQAPQVVGSGIAILSAVCGYHPPQEVEAIVLAAGVMAPLVTALTTFAADKEMLGCTIPLLKALTQCVTGREAARDAGTEAALVTLLTRHPSEPELHAEVAAIRSSLAQARPKGGRALAKGVGEATKGKAAAAPVPRRRQQGADQERIDAVYAY